ncbi:hypothetical protein GQA70_21145 (plasmid) [Ponticoccus alexandrii]|uniref:Uncharacterized protein n=1 Tax=Ponticoccus alexandrii TaxID=1943633 RepID=A0ABX7FH13_9RHOB|nr:nitrous oxide reductase accessory protein NosL [Ponticoccus alexandrii]QRF68949.1 hypothetical protein GQA70_21145 [Ponticoccus alexandrii]
MFAGTGRAVPRGGPFKTAIILKIRSTAALCADCARHYCQMFVADHPGPKAQVHVKGRSALL